MRSVKARRASRRSTDSALLYSTLLYSTSFYVYVTQQCRAVLLYGTGVLQYCFFV